MALVKTIELKNSGVELNYWRITRVEIDRLQNSTKVFLSGYTTKEARDAGKKPLHTIGFDWRGSDNPITASVLMAGQAYPVCYAKVKAQAAGLGISNPVIFNDATDI